MFVDSSAIVAILTAAPSAAALADALEKARAPITSPLAIVEAIQGLRRLRHSSVAEAQADVVEFLTIAGVQTVAISARETDAAADAMARYGVGTGHPAQLNLADCLAYAVARNYRAPLLSADARFSLTDAKTSPV